MSVLTAEAMELEQDEAARDEAVDTTRSFLVQAPAGSGKTELLTQRFLALLAVVEEPEHVLAITFTRDATAEMRTRVVEALQKAAMPRERGVEDDSVAARALRRANDRGWSLLQQPHRLNIQTIDSVNLQIAHEAPLLSRLGGQLQPTEAAEPLYALAARRTIEQLGGADSALTRALENVLRLRNVDVAECEKLIAEMLRKRDHWLAEFPVEALHPESDWATLRGRLEGPMRREHERVKGRIKDLLQQNASHAGRLFALAEYACGNEATAPIHGLKNVRSFEGLIEHDHYCSLRNILLTQDGNWFKSTAVNSKIGFPTPKNGGSKERKQHFQDLLLDLEKILGLREALCELKHLPAEKYSEEEWGDVQSIFMVLLHAAAQLRVVFAEKSRIDFVEVGMTADHALQDPEVRRRWSEQIHHLLVDEFQDTSRRQYELLRNIVRDWEPSESRTCFIVGDPMQSIYLFRQAEPALFSEVRAHGFGQDAVAVRFSQLTLCQNFRSTAGIVQPLNDMFTAMQEARGQQESKFAPAIAKAGTPVENAVSIHVQAESADNQADLRQSEAESAVKIIRRHRQAIHEARAAGTEFRIGVLVRARTHLLKIAAALREAGISYRAIEIENLEERQEIRDLLSLMRALLSPLDRIAWLSVLRAPWCGLRLSDLHLLSGNDDPSLQKRPLPELLGTRGTLLSEDGARKAARLHGILQVAVSQRFSGDFSVSPSGFASWIERTWHSLGGHLCVDSNARENVTAFFRMLAELTPDGIEASDALLQQRLDRLFALPGAEVTEKAGVQLMTIHKAKGLGFDVVIVPALERITGGVDAPLLRWMTRTRPESDERELLIAPIGNKGGKTSATYEWVGKQQGREELAEVDRLLYVACTRARKELHLYGVIGLKQEGKDQAAIVEMCEPKERSMLKAGWPYLKAIFEAKLNEQNGTMRAGPFLLPQPTRQQGDGIQLAAGAQNGQLLRRLPDGWQLSSAVSPRSGSAVSSFSTARVTSASRAGAQAAGIVLHALFQAFAGLAENDPRRDVTLRRDHWKNVATALLRHAGLSSRELNTQRARVLGMLQAAVTDEYGRWILSRQPEERSESAWTTEETGHTRTVRADRVFVAGGTPRQAGTSHLWIVDYKTTEIDNAEGLFMQEERDRHTPQLEGYAKILRDALPCDLPVILALYYPAVPHLLWWPA